MLRTSSKISGARTAWALCCAAGLALPAWAQDDSSLTPEKKEEPAAAPAAQAPAAAPSPAASPSPSVVPATEAPQPAAATGAAGEEEISLAAFSEPVQLTTLVELLATTLQINVQVKGDIPGTVVFNAPVAVKKKDLMGLVDALLEQQGYTITLNSAGFYAVLPLAEVPLSFDGARPNTRVISTPNVRPSSLQQVLMAQMGGSAPQGGQGGGGLSFFDDLGIIVATGPTRRLDSIESFVKRIVQENTRSEYIRVELRHVTAAAARERVMQLKGQARQITNPNDPNAAIQQQQQQAAMAAAPGRVGSLDNIGDRLTIDPQSNALIFRGMPSEVAELEELIAIIDQPTALEPKRYAVGPQASQIADIARTRGLGEVTTIAAPATSGRGGNLAVDANRLNAAQAGMQSGQSHIGTGGPTMVIDEERGTILYYATAEQHAQMAKLITELDPQQEVIVIKEYKLAHSKAIDVADLVNSLITNQEAAPRNDLLPGGRSERRERRSGIGNSSRSGSMRDSERDTASTARTSTPRASAGAGGDLAIGEIDAFVVADEKNNQIIVKAAQKYQDDFKKLIDKLDKRRPQVYIEAKIVSVTWDDSMRLRFETQLINASGRGGLFETNFGLSTAGTGSTITTPKNPTPGIGGFTAALIQSRYTPIIINALQNEGDARVVASPQLLVDDNEEAEIVSLDQQPTTTTQIGTGGSPNVTSFNDYAEAGTTLSVSPQISGGSELVLEYQIEQSSFTGQGSDGIPPPRVENTVSSRVTLPSDTTVVVGGLTVDSARKTIAKIPLLGDIPILGLAFQDRNTGDRKTTLYVFLTPRIVRDPNFADLRLLTMGPMSASDIREDFPRLKPSAIEMGELPFTPPTRERAAPERPSPAPAAPSATRPAPANAVPVQPAPVPEPEPVEPEAEDRPPIIMEGGD